MSSTLHPLRQQLAAVRGRLRSLLVVYGICWAVAAPLLLVCLLGGLDYLSYRTDSRLRVLFDDAGMRLMWSLLVLGVFALVTWRFLIRGLLSHFRDVDLALRIENRFPHLRGRLASSVEFLQQAESDASAGSPVLRRAVIKQTQTDVERLNLRETVDARRTLAASLAAAGVVFLAVLLVVLNPEAARRAAARIADPLGDRAWPQRNHLEFRDPPSRAALGAPVEFTLVDAEGAALPPEVSLHFLYDGESRERVVTMRPLETEDAAGGTSAAPAAAVVHKEKAVRRSFRYRATGGDHRDMPWRRLEVVEPPEVKSLELELFPPAYANWPPVKSSKHVRALVGTRVELKGATQRPIARAEVVLDDESTIPLQVTDGGLGFASISGAKPLLRPDDGSADDGSANDGASAEDETKTSPPTARDAEALPSFEVKRSGHYWIRLTDAQGLANHVDVRQQSQITAVPDDAPHVRIEQPQPGPSEVYIYVTPEAVVPIAVSVSEDHTGIQRVELRYTRSDGPAAPQTDGARDFSVTESPAAAGADGAEADANDQIAAVLHTGPASAPVREKGLDAPELGEDGQYTFQWDLSPLKLPPKTQLNLVATATDYQPVWGRSEPRRLMVISADELQDRIAERQSSILAKLAAILASQRQARLQLGEVQAQLNTAGTLGPQDVQQLKAAQLSQSQVHEPLSDPSAGVLAEIAELLQALKYNKLDSPEIEGRMNTLRGQLQNLESGHLLPIRDQLREAQVQVDQLGRQAAVADQGAQLDTALKDQLDNAADHQEQVIAGLENILGELTEWDNYRSFARQVGAVRREHEDLVQRTAQTAPKTLGKDLPQLSAAERAELAKIDGRHQELARRMDVIGQQMQQMIGDLRGNDDEAADVLFDALHHANQQDISGRMHAAGRSVAKNQIGEASRQQSAASEQLGEMLDILSNRREHGLQRRAEQLRAAEEQLKGLRERQKELQQGLKQAGQETNSAQKQRELQRLAEEQRRLQAETERFSRQLQRLQAKKAGEKARDAAAQMGRSAEQSQGQQGDQAEQAAEQAERDLEEAQQQLAQERQQAEQDLAFEQLAKIEDALTGLSDRQRAMLDETQRLEKLRLENNSLTRGQRETVRELSRAQRVLAQETRAISQKLEAAEVFHLALGYAADQMGIAADLLAEERTDQPTQQAQESILGRFAQLLEALQPEKPKEGEGANPMGPGDEQPQQPRQPHDGIPDVAQLKLLLLMEREIKTRTEELQIKLADKQDLTDAERKEFDQLSRRQGELADLVMKIERQLRERQEDEAEKLPELELEDEAEEPQEKEKDQPRISADEPDKKRGVFLSA